MAGGRNSQKAWKDNIRPMPPARMTAAEFNTLQAMLAPKANKYGAVPVNDPEHGFFHSTREHQWYLHLCLRQRAGEIKDLKRQHRYQLNVNGVHVCDYIADATYTEIKPGKGFVVADLKGYETPEYKIKRALFRATFGFDITEVK